MSEELDDIRKELFSISKESYGNYYEKHLLKQYKLYIEMMDRTSARRSSANTFFLTINSAIIAIMGILTKIAGCPLFINILWIIMSSVFGILLCYRWDDLIKSYSDLNTGRFVIIHLLEERLPARLFKSEWSYLKPKEGEPRYTEMTITEKRVPHLFRILYFLLVIIGLISYIAGTEFQTILTKFLNG